MPPLHGGNIMQAVIIYLAYEKRTDNKPLQSTALRVTAFASFSVAAANAAPLRAATERRRYAYDISMHINLPSSV